MVGGVRKANLNPSCFVIILHFLYLTEKKIIEHHIFLLFAAIILRVIYVKCIDLYCYDLFNIQYFC